MPLTTLDASVALIVIDLQKGLLAVPTVHPLSEIIHKTASLARAFRSRGLPVVLVNVIAAPQGRTDAGPRKFTFPPDWTEHVPELDQQPADLLISKRGAGAFHGTPLNSVLRDQGVSQVVLTGISTSFGVESTARSAYDLGYNVVMVTDAMTDRDADSHNHSIAKIFPKLGETATTDDLLQAIAGR
jgi:nicotinamidase-related amidase